MSSVTLSSHKRATQTSSHRRQGFISTPISKVLPPADYLLSFLISFFFNQLLKTRHLDWTQKCSTLNITLKYTAQTIISREQQIFGTCIIFVSSILIHVSPQGRSKVSVTVSDDQTFFVGLGAGPRRCNHSVLTQSNVAVVLYQQRYQEAFLQSFNTAGSWMFTRYRTTGVWMMHQCHFNWFLWWIFTFHATVLEGVV